MPKRSAPVHNRELNVAQSWKYVFVADKHVGVDRLVPILPVRRITSAQLSKPDILYSGTHKNDEDYYHVLQLAFENYATLLTSDGGMPSKARAFQDEQPKRERDRCFRGIIILPRDADAQVQALEVVAKGNCHPSKPGGLPDGPVLLHQVDDFNLTLDLRGGAGNAKLSHLCDCK